MQPSIGFDLGSSRDYTVTQQRRSGWYGNISGNSKEGPGADAGPFLRFMGATCRAGQAREKKVGRSDDPAPTGQSSA